MAVAHFAFDFGPWRQCCDGVDDDDVERTRADEHVGNFERLFTGVGLRDEQLVDVDPNRAGVDGVHRVFCVDVGTDAAVALGLGDNVHREGRLTRRFGTVDLDHAATGQAAHAEGDVERDGAGADGLDRHAGFLAHPHDRALAELLVDLCQGRVEGLVAVARIIRVVHDVIGTVAC